MANQKQKINIIASEHVRRNSAKYYRKKKESLKKDKKSQIKDILKLIRVPFLLHRPHCLGEAGRQRDVLLRKHI